MSRHGPHVTLDLDEVRLVDAAAVCFLARCEAEGMELRNLRRATSGNGWIGSDSDSVETNSREDS